MRGDNSQLLIFSTVKSEPRGPLPSQSFPLSRAPSCAKRNLPASRLRTDQESLPKGKIRRVKKRGEGNLLPRKHQYRCSRSGNCARKW
jgi:hypothetical protein